MAVAGDKPRPAVLIQSDALGDVETILICLLTTTIRDAPLSRLSIAPTAVNGLDQPSQVMVDKIFAIVPAKVGQRVGSLSAVDMARLNEKLALVLGLADPVGA